MNGERGFSLVEVAVATALVLLLVASVFEQFNRADGAFAMQSEDADMQQRLRAAFDALRRDLAQAGTSGEIRRDGAALVQLAPPVLPMRIGLRDADPPGSFRRDVITMLSAPAALSTNTTLAQAMPARVDVARLTVDPGCSSSDQVCGFPVDSDLLIADDEGAFDLFTVTGVAPPTRHLRRNTTGSPSGYPAGSVIAPVGSRTYALRAGNAVRPPQLVRYDGGSGPDVPVIDHVVGLSFEYFGEPEPPRMRRPLSATSGPWTTYGVKPPKVDPTATSSVAGSNCLFQGNGSTIATPRLPALGGAAAPLIPLTAAQLSDGPWCPNDTAPGRYDADLLRIRSIVFTIRVESGREALRGPAGVLFSRPGRARSADRYLPDLELRARITPSSLALRR